MENYQPYYQPNNKRLLWLLNIFIVIMVTIIILLIVIIIKGDSQLRLDIPANTAVHINNHVVNSRLLKILPGSYQIIFSSPTISPYQGILNVGLFGTTTYHPYLKDRSVNSIASSLIGAVGTGGSPQPGLVRWFNDNTWVVGLVVPGDADLAMHYDSKQQWVVGFYNVDGYPDSLSSLPANVAAYIKELETNNAGG